MSVVRVKVEQKHHYKKRVMAYLLIISLVPVLILGSYAYYTYMTNVIQKVSHSAKNSVNQLQEQVDSILINIRKSYIEEVERDEIKWILTQDMWYSDYSYIVDAINVLDGDKYLVDYISGFTFINFKTNWVLSNRGMYPYTLVKNKEEVEKLRNFDVRTIERVFWVDHMDRMDNSLKLSRETVNLNNLCLVMKLPSMKKEPYGLLIVNINRNKLKKMLVDQLIDEDMTIFNEQGNVIFSSDKEVEDYIKANHEKVTHQESGQGRMLNGKRLVFATSKSNVVPWTYVVSCDLNTLEQGASDIVFLTLLILCVMVVLVVGTLYFAYRIYYPIGYLMQHVDKLFVSNENVESKDEFEYIATGIDQLADNNLFLEKLIQNQQSQLTELLQLRLINGHIKAEQVEAYMRKLGICKEAYYVIMSMNVKVPVDTEAYDEAKQDVLRIDVIEQMPQELMNSFLMRPICNHRAISIIVNGETEESVNECVIKVYRELERYVRSQYQLVIRVGVSALFKELIDYRKAYNQSIEAMKNSEALEDLEEKSHSELVFYSDVTPYQEVYTYDITIEEEIKGAVDSGRKEEAFKIIDHFIDTLVQAKVAHYEWTLYLHRFLIAIMSVVNDAGLSVNQLFEKDKHSIFMSIEQIYEIDQLRKFFKYEVVTPVIEGLNEYRKSKSSEIIQAIEKLIDEAKGDITLGECSERLHYHPTYIWKIMKCERNITFSDYIAEYKLKEAKYLLTETKMTIAEIGAKLNYTNTQNFIRFFSKQEGITPGKYRQQHSKMISK